MLRAVDGEAGSGKASGSAVVGSTSLLHSPALLVQRPGIVSSAVGMVWEIGFGDVYIYI